MKRYSLLIRKSDRRVFEAIKSGTKKIETRAATDRYKKVKVGDILVFTCGKDKLEKQVSKVHYFKDIESLVKELDLKLIMPFVSSIEEAKKIWYSFPRYKEKLEKHGLITFKMDK